MKARFINMNTNQVSVGKPLSKKFDIIKVISISTDLIQWISRLFRKDYQLPRLVMLDETFYYLTVTWAKSEVYAGYYRGNKAIMFEVGDSEKQARKNLYNKLKDKGWLV